MDANTTFQQDTSGVMAYPDRGTVSRAIFHAPLIVWRSGLGGILGNHMLVLTTWGRKSHIPRSVGLSYTPLNDRIYLGAGWGERCEWYQNLLADPHVTVQVWSEQVTGLDEELVIPAMARRVTEEGEFRSISQRLFETGSDAYFKPWLKSLGIAYDQEEMIAKRERIREVALDLQSTDTAKTLREKGYPPPMDIDLQWIWPFAAGSFMLGWMIGKRRR